jgi:hypothetical protein
MGKDSRWAFPSESPSAITQTPSPLSNSQLLGYRAAVADLVQEASRRLGPSNLAAAERLVARRLGQREFASVLSRLDGGVGATAER